MAVTTTETTSSTTNTDSAEQRPTLERPFQVTESLRVERDAGRAIAQRAARVR